MISKLALVSLQVTLLASLASSEKCDRCDSGWSFIYHSSMNECGYGSECVSPVKDKHSEEYSGGVDKENTFCGVRLCDECIGEWEAVPNFSFIWERLKCNIVKCGRTPTDPFTVSGRCEFCDDGKLVRGKYPTLVNSWELLELGDSSPVGTIDGVRIASNRGKYSVYTIEDTDFIRVCTHCAQTNKHKSNMSNWLAEPFFFARQSAILRELRNEIRSRHWMYGNVTNWSQRRWKEVQDRLNSRDVMKNKRVGSERCFIGEDKRPVVADYGDIAKYASSVQKKLNKEAGRLNTVIESQLKEIRQRKEDEMQRLTGSSDAPTTKMDS